jgi:phytoene dehydrogenase-like protein
MVGAGTHPGAGVPGVLSSAKVVEHLLAEDFPQTQEAKNDFAISAT